MLPISLWNPEELSHDPSPEERPGAMLSQTQLESQPQPMKQWWQVSGSKGPKRGFLTPPLNLFLQWLSQASNATARGPVTLKARKGGSVSPKPTRTAPASATLEQALQGMQGSMEAQKLFPRLSLALL